MPSQVFYVVFCPCGGGGCPNANQQLAKTTTKEEAKRKLYEHLKNSSYHYMRSAAANAAVETAEIEAREEEWSDEADDEMPIGASKGPVLRRSASAV